MKKNVLIVTTLVILGIGLGYLAYKTNIQEEEIAINPETIAFTTNGTGVLSTGNNLSGESKTTTANGDLYKSIRTELVNDIRKHNKENKHTPSDNCSKEIGDVEALAKDIASYTGQTINKLTIKDACGKQREFASSINNQDIKGAVLKQENSKYIIYSLIDNNRDLAYIEYPIIVYDKIKETNTLTTISYRTTGITYLDDEGYFILKIGGYEDGDTEQFLFRINESEILGKFNIPFMDCGDQGLLDNQNNKIILHNFNKEKCGYDYDSRDLKEESKLIGKLTYEPLSTPLGDFSKDSKLYRTNEDIVESAKNDTTIFHIDNTQYEIKNNTLIKR